MFNLENLNSFFQRFLKNVKKSLLKLDGLKFGPFHAYAWENSDGIDISMPPLRIQIGFFERIVEVHPLLKLETELGRVDLIQFNTEIYFVYFSLELYEFWLKGDYDVPTWIKIF
jgi:hypothetical protein